MSGREAQQNHSSPTGPAARPRKGQIAPGQERKVYKLKRCSNKECCKQCRYVMFKGTMTKWPVQKLAQGTTQKLLQHHDATDI